MAKTIPVEWVGVGYREEWLFLGNRGGLAVARVEGCYNGTAEWSVGLALGQPCARGNSGSFDAAKRAAEDYLQVAQEGE